jgi:hypothetical protein
MEGSTLTTEKFICNPDVVLREEDEDGALLFNPDTNQVKVINNTALYIWKLCGSSCSLTELVANLKEAFDEVPADQVEKDVQSFIADMIESGFIGKV